MRKEEDHVILYEDIYNLPEDNQTMRDSISIKPDPETHRREEDESSTSMDVSKESKLKE